MQGPINSNSCSGETRYLMKILGEDAPRTGQSGMTFLGIFAVTLYWTGPFILHLCASPCPGTTVVWKRVLLGKQLLGM